MPKRITIYKTLIFVLDFPNISTFTKKRKEKTLQIFWVANECDNDSKIDVSYQNGWLPKKKKCDTNKNMTKMGVIIKGVYCI